MEFNITHNKKTVISCLLLVYVIPQVLLLIINLSAWNLIKSEVDAIAVKYALIIFCWLVGLISLSLVVLFAYIKDKLKIAWLLAGFYVAVSTGYMLFVFFETYKIVPTSIPIWMLNSGTIVFLNIALMMPSAFVSLYVLSKYFFSRVWTQKNAVMAPIALALTSAVLWYLFVSLMQPLWYRQFGVVAGVLFTTLFLIIFLAAIIYIFDIISHKIFSQTSRTQMLYMFLVGLLMPIAGLALNKEIPFPADFQTIGVYAFTIVNGLLVLIRPASSKYPSVLLFLRFLTYPFIVYFFWVFLPFLPLSLIAVLALGLGFLMLAPLILGVLQTKINYLEYKHVVSLKGKQHALIICVAGCLVLPCYFLSQALIDKYTIHKSLDYFYAHDNNSDALTQFEIDRSANALIKLRNKKEGVQLPYISFFYNRIVFGGLVLQNKKIADMYMLLKNKKMPPASPSFDFIFGANKKIRGRNTRIEVPTTDTSIESVEASHASDTLATLKLRLRNNTQSSNALFVGNFHLPEGVFITGLRLKINNKWESAQVVDKKTALWIFKKVTEVRRDPAMLYYKSPAKVELHVYPFPKKGVREVEVDFSFNPNADSNVVFNNRLIALSGLSSKQSRSLVFNDAHVVSLIDLAQYSFDRQPYLHFILNYSQGQKRSAESYLQSIQQISNKLKIKNLTVSAANIHHSLSTSSVVFNIKNENSIKTFIENILLDESAGFWPEQALAAQILNTQKALDQSNLNQVPVFILLDTPILNTVDVSAWQWLIPDLKSWYVYAHDTQKLKECKLKKDLKLCHENLLKSKAINNRTLFRYALVSESKPVFKRSVSDARSQTPVIILKIANKLRVVSLDKTFLIDAKSQDALIYNPNTHDFETLVTQTTQATDFKDWMHYAQAWNLWRQANMNPAELESQRLKLLDLSKKYAVMLPISSYIVLENDAERKTLANKEKQAMKNHGALDFDEKEHTPEPAWWLGLLFLLLFMYVKKSKHLSKNGFQA